MSVVVFGAMLTAAHAEEMSIKDYLIDRDKLTGHMVSMVGWPSCMGATVCSLNSGGEASQSLIFDPLALDRTSRRKLLDCDMFTRNCKVKITGKGKGGDSPQFWAATIEWLQSP